MWSICSVPNKYTKSTANVEKVTYHLLTNKEYKLGRSPNCDLSFPENKAMSREHATLILNYKRDQINSTDVLPTITFRDKSTSGTMFQPKNKTIKGVDIDIDEPTVFWIGKSSYKIVYEPLVICPSGFNVEEKKDIENDILTLGAHIVNEWSSHVTHCLSNKIILTKKVVCALASGKPIVQRGFISKLVTNFSSNITTTVDPKDYLPKFVAVNLQEMGVKPSDCCENMKRNNLLRGWKFFLMNRNQKLLLANALKELDAQVVIVESENDAKLLYQEIGLRKTCVLGVDLNKIESCAVRNIFPLIRKKLNNLGKRFITDSDVAMAMIKCDPVTYCDPSVPAQSQLQTNSEHSQILNNVFLNTKTSSTSSPPSRKRPSSSFEENSFKRSRQSTDSHSLRIEDTGEQNSATNIFRDTDINSEKERSNSDKELLNNKEKKQAKSSKDVKGENEENNTQSDIIQSSIPWPSSDTLSSNLKTLSPVKKSKKLDQSNEMQEITENPVKEQKSDKLKSTNKWLSKKRVPEMCKYIPENDTNGMTEAVVCVKSANLIQEHGINRRKKYKERSKALPEIIGFSDMVKHTVKTIGNVSSIPKSNQQFMEVDSASQKVNDLFN